MRKLPKPTEQEISEGPQTVSFQIANGNARQGCILQTRFPTKLQAQKYLLTNWPITARATIIKESLRKPVVAGSGVIVSMMDRG